MHPSRLHRPPAFEGLLQCSAVASTPPFTSTSADRKALVFRSGFVRPLVGFLSCLPRNCQREAFSLKLFSSVRRVPRICFCFCLFFQQEMAQWLGWGKGTGPCRGLGLSPQRPHGNRCYLLASAGSAHMRYTQTSRQNSIHTKMNKYF